MTGQHGGYSRISLRAYPLREVAQPRGESTRYPGKINIKGQIDTARLLLVHSCDDCLCNCVRRERREEETMPSGRWMLRMREQWCADVPRTYERGAHFASMIPARPASERCASLIEE